MLHEPEGDSEESGVNVSSFTQVKFKINGKINYNYFFSIILYFHIRVMYLFIGRGRQS